MTIEAALARTLLLMRDDIRDDAPAADLLEALVGIRIALVGDARNLASHSAQSAFVSAAMLCARSGATVHLVAPDVSLVGPQPLLRAPNLIQALTDIDGFIVPKKCFVPAAAPGRVDLAVMFGDGPWTGTADVVRSVNADAWSTLISEPTTATEWIGGDWPFGGLAAAAIVAGEGYKAAMRKLRHWRRHEMFDEYFAPAGNARVALAPASTPSVSDLGEFDFVSGGAVTHGALFALARIPKVNGKVRVIEDDTNAISNANRYSLLTLDRLNILKADDLATQALFGMDISPLPFRFEQANMGKIGQLALAVLVGVDDIPARWAVQDAAQGWLGIGATSHYGMMTTIHQPHLPCARCAHPRDDSEPREIPTVSFVSFWAGLFLAARYLRYLSVGREVPEEQETWFSPLRPEEPPRLTRVQRRAACACSRHRNVLDVVA
jgi:hypothetical protein